MAQLRKVDLGGYTLTTWRGPDDAAGAPGIEYELMSAAGHTVRRGRLRWPTGRLASETRSRRLISRAIDSDASLRAILNVIGKLERIGAHRGGDDDEEPSEALLKWYSSFDTRLHELVTGERPFTNLDGWE
ncbi:MAG: hypothetical protein ACYCWW_05070 [Deltaproteobacteria bacterium]